MKDNINPNYEAFVCVSPIAVILGLCVFLAEPVYYGITMLYFFAFLYFYYIYMCWRFKRLIEVEKADVLEPVRDVYFLYMFVVYYLSWLLSYFIFT